MRKFTFEKESDNNWYIVLPEWEGEHWELEMIMGADTMLDIISQGNSPIDVIISEEYFNGCTYTLTFLREEEGGGWYELKSDLFKFEVWLCHVTKFVFGYLPKKLYL